MTVLTGCTTTEAEPDRNYGVILAQMIPPVPDVPSFPELTWGYEEGKYFIGEEDVDKLLDYGENQIPLFRFELQQFEAVLEEIKAALIGGPDST